MGTTETDGNRTPWTPLPPRPIYFDSECKSWVISRYADVLAALREPALLQAGAKPNTDLRSVRRGVKQALAAADLGAFEIRMKQELVQVVDRLPSRESADLVADVLHPWSLRIATAFLRCSPGDARRIVRLAPWISGSLAQNNVAERNLLWRKVIGLRRRLADLEQNRLLSRAIPGARSLLLGLSQTLPAFLANMGAALLERPNAAAALKKLPAFPNAVEELLRFAGPVHTLHRIASTEIQANDAIFRAGDRVLLRIDSANHDTEEFRQAGEIDFSRNGPAHLALGMGPHFCVGSQLVRIAAPLVVSRLFLSSRIVALAAPVTWSYGETLAIATRLRVNLSPISSTGINDARKEPESFTRAAPR